MLMLKQTALPSCRVVIILPLYLALVEALEYYFSFWFSNTGKLTEKLEITREQLGGGRKDWKNNSL